MRCCTMTGISTGRPRDTGLCGHRRLDRLGSPPRPAARRSHRLRPALGRGACPILTKPVAPVRDVRPHVVPFFHRAGCPQSTRWLDGHPGLLLPSPPSAPRRRESHPLQRSPAQVPTARPSPASEPTGHRVGKGGCTGSLADELLCTPARSAAGSDACACAGLQGTNSDMWSTPSNHPLKVDRIRRNTRLGL